MIVTNDCLKKETWAISFKILKVMNVIDYCKTFQETHAKFEYGRLKCENLSVKYFEISNDNIHDCCYLFDTRKSEFSNFNYA